MLPVPLLLEFLFPESAESVLPLVSPRLLRWCSSFDSWLAERRQSRPPKDRTHAIRSWRSLLGVCGKPPWEITQADIEQHAAWMESNGYSPISICSALTFISAFYRWCAEHQPDPECPPSFNPAAGVARPKYSRRPVSPLLSRLELASLIGYMRRDISALGRRDYAFILARLRLGVPLQRLQRLRWEQIECDASIGDESGAWVRLQPGDSRLPLPADAWEAIRLWLEQTGRLPLMQPGDYIFTPLVDPLHEAAADRPQAWASGKFLSSTRLRGNLKLYSRRLGLPEEKLTWRSLRLTALRLRLDAGDSPEQLHTFLDRQSKKSAMPSYLKGLPELPPSAAPDGPDNPDGPDRSPPAEPELPLRTSGLYQPWHRITHGLYASSQPPEQLSAVLAEDIQGLDAEISALRLLERLLLRLQVTAASPREAAKLADACTLAGERLARLIEAETQLSRPDESARWVEEFFAGMDGLPLGDGRFLSSAEWRRQLEEEDDGPALAANSRSLEEEVACARLVLRNTFALAEPAAQAGQCAELVHLAEIYGAGCNRLVKLLRRCRSSSSRMEMKVRAMIDEVLAEVQKTWTID
jgi:hypothetical protein